MFFLIYCTAGLISLGSSKDLREIAGALYAFNVPFVSVTLPDASAGGRTAEDALLGKYDNLLTTVPDRAGQITVGKIID